MARAASGFLALACLALLPACSNLGAWDLIARGAPGSGSNEEDGTTTPSTDPPTAPDTIVCKRRMRIDLNGICTDAAVKGFPLLIHLSSGSPVYAECRTDGLDIRFRDKDGNNLPFEIESWTLNGDSYIWVKVDFQGDAASDYIHVYFSSESTGLSDRSDPSKVWSNGYVAVWHGKSTALLKDSVSAEHDGSATDFTSPTSSTGQIGGGIAFSGSDSGFSVAAAPDLNDLKVLTIEAWLEDSGSASGSAILSKGPLSLSIAGGNMLNFSAAFEGACYAATSSTALLGSGWKDIVVTWTGSTKECIFYSDGSSTTETASPAQGGSSDASQPLIIGNSADKNKGITAKLDELRISNEIRSEAWIQAQFKSQSGSALNYGPAEDAP